MKKAGDTSYVKLIKASLIYGRTDSAQNGPEFYLDNLLMESKVLEAKRRIWPFLL